MKVVVEAENCKCAKIRIKVKKVPRSSSTNKPSFSSCSTVNGEQCKELVVDLTEDVEPTIKKGDVILQCEVDFTFIEEDETVSEGKEMLKALEVPKVKP